jgi:hypothetical protein
MAAHTKWWHILQASKKEACLAVDVYNRSSGDRNLEAFVVHMHLAWLYLLHARFLRDGMDYRYRHDNRHFVRVDGEVKTWELARCVQEEFADENDPVRRNIEFFIKLRNMVEHRYEELLAYAVAGKVQAHVLNFEEAVTARFGANESLGDKLRFPVFMSSLTPDAVEALKRIHRRLPKRLTNFIRDHDASLPDEVQGDWRYDFRVLLIARTGPKTEADAVMRFVREDEMPEEVREVVQTIVRTRSIAVQNKGRYKPGGVSLKVQEGLGWPFTITDHTSAWRHFGVRPPTDADRPELTDERYCVWDEPHGDYLYTEAWVKKLIKDLKDPDTYEDITGRRRRRSSGG